MIRFLVDSKTPREKSGGVWVIGFSALSFGWGRVHRKIRFAVLLTGFLWGFTSHPTKGGDFHNSTWSSPASRWSAGYSLLHWTSIRLHPPLAAAHSVPLESATLVTSRSVPSTPASVSPGFPSVWRQAGLHSGGSVFRRRGRRSCRRTRRSRNPS